MKNIINRRSFIQKVGMLSGICMSPDILNGLDCFEYVFSDQPASLMARTPICFIGVGGSGINIIDYMIEAKLAGVKFIAINTDLKGLERSKAEIKIQIGRKITNGMGTENNPQVGKDAALENIQTIKEAIYGSHMVFIITGLGGGTGTGAAPVVAEICHEMEILTIAVVSKPFTFEGKKRMVRAEMGLRALRAVVDTVIIIPTDCFRSLVNKEATAFDLFTKIDEIFYHSVSGIMLSGFPCVNFANMRSEPSKTGMVTLSGTRGVNLKFTTCVLLTLEEITEATIYCQKSEP